MGILFTKAMGNVLTALVGNVLTTVMGKVLDIYNFKLSTYFPRKAQGVHMGERCISLSV